MIKLSRELKTGLVALITIILFIWGFSFIKSNNLFKKERIFFAVYDNVQGLAPSSLVTINGFKVGKIDDITFHPKIKGALVVKFSLNNDFQFSKVSVAKIYSSDLMGTKSLSVVPNYEGELAKTGDTLYSESEQGMFEMLNEKIAPLQSKIEGMIVNADLLMHNINKILDSKTQENIKESINNLKNTLLTFENTSKSADALLTNNQANLSEIIKNSKEVTENLKQFSDSLTEVNIAQTITKFNESIANINLLLTDVNSGKGTLGKLVKDDKLYQNFTNASKELEELLRDMKLHPKRFVHFSVFGKKDKAYNPKDSLK